MTAVTARPCAFKRARASIKRSSEQRRQQTLTRSVLATYADVMDAEGLKMLIDEAADDDPRRALAAAAALRREAERLQAVAVRRARVGELSWAEIAALLQVTKQAAHRKYRGRSLRPGRDG